MDARRDIVSFAVKVRMPDRWFLDIYILQPGFLVLSSLSFFIFPAHRSNRLGRALWNLKADIMPATTQSGNSLLALDLNIKQRVKLPSIEIPVDT